MHWIIEKLHHFGDKKAIVCKEKDYSYTDLFIRIQEYDELLSTRVLPGEVVAIHADYSFPAIAVFLALFNNKNVIVPVTNSVDEEVRERLREAQVDKIIRFEDGEIVITPFETTGEKHGIIVGLVQSKKSGLVLFSSGSTGRPKAMVHELDAFVETYRDKRPRDLTILVFLMFDHIGGLNTLYNALATGTTLIIPANRDADHICSLIEVHKIHILPASPTFLNLLLISDAIGKYDLSSLKMVTYGTEPMPESLLQKLKQVFPRVKFLQTFGTSETGIANTSSKSSSSILMKIEGGAIEHKIVDGELWLRSKTQILGYLNASMESFTEDGWFRTGDLIELSEDGFMKIVGRNKEVINVGGEKVLPSEIESVLLSMPAIADCMVYGEVNAIIGQIVAVDVVLHEGIDPKEIKKMIRAFCKDKLDSYKIPVKVSVVARTNFNARFKKIRSTVNAEV